MKKIDGYWLDPAVDEVASTPNLGIRLEGLSDRRPNSAGALCGNCGVQLSLLATYEKSAFVPLSRFAIISLEFCRACSAESDGSAEGNGFFPLLRQLGELMPLPLLPEPVFFRATPTGEPFSEVEFRKWHPRIMRGKLGGRQLSIQPALETYCPKCSGPLVFVASIDEAWAASILNFGGGFGYLFVCRAECSPNSTLFYWDCD